MGLCSQNWTAERLNRLETVIQSLRLRMQQARRPLSSGALPRQESEMSISERGSHTEGDDAYWPLGDDALSEADSLEIVQDLERRLDRLRGSLAGSSHSLSEEQVLHSVSAFSALVQ